MRVGQWKKGKNAFSYFSITSHFSFLLFHTAKGMNKDGAGPSSWTKRKKPRKERKVENESFSKDIHDAFGSFMLQCSSLFHLSKSLRNKNEAKLLRYFLLFFYQTEGFALTHIG